LPKYTFINLLLTFSINIVIINDYNNNNDDDEHICIAPYQAYSNL